jgi:CubicO group peptidase (beta-lactamase class C family)
MSKCENFRRSIGFGLALTLTVSALPAQAPIPAESLRVATDARISALITPLTGRDTPGMALIVAHRGRIIHRSGHGVANVTTGAPFTPSTPNYVASVGKMFTALLIMRLVERDQLELETRLGEVLPTAPAYTHRLTMAELLTHTSGLIDYYDVGGEERGYTTADVLQIIQQTDSLLFVPGTRNSYSNSAYVLLAQVIERITQMSYGAALRKEFLEPLGMRETFVSDGSSALPANRGRGYRKTASGWEDHDYNSSTLGSGGVYASVDDLYRFWAAMRDGKVVSAPSMARAQTMQLLSNGRGTPYGMGWLAESDGRGPLKDKMYVAAVGQLRGFWSLLKWYFNDDLVVIWTSNAAENTLFDALRPIPEIVLAP